MIASLLSALGLKDEPLLGPASGVRATARGVEVGDVLHAYVPRRDAPNRPGVVATPCIVLGRDVSQGRPVLLVAPLRALPKGAEAPSGTEIDLVAPETLKRAGINRAARADAADQRILPMDPAFFAAGARVGSIGSLDDPSFDRMRAAYRMACQRQAMRAEAREINLRAGYGKASAPRRPADAEAAL
jgi:hypothetical protein